MRIDSYADDATPYSCAEYISSVISNKELPEKISDGLKIIV